MKDGRVIQVFSGVGISWRGKSIRKKVKEGKYDGCVLYLYMKIE
jgi:hypothetical protein